MLSGVGQLFIYGMIASYGPLTLSLVTTTRKFFTILVSVLWFGHHVSTMQWFGVVLVFIGLTWKEICEHQKEWVGRSGGARLRRRASGTMAKSDRRR